jgi:hypothetical protein
LESSFAIDRAEAAAEVHPPSVIIDGLHSGVDADNKGGVDLAGGGELYKLAMFGPVHGVERPADEESAAVVSGLESEDLTIDHWVERFDHCAGFDVVGHQIRPIQNRPGVGLNQRELAPKHDQTTKLNVGVDAAVQHDRSVSPGRLRDQHGAGCWFI